MIQERKFQNVSYKDLQNCVRWCQNYLNLRDWNIELYEGVRDKEDRAEGWTIINPGDEFHYKAEMWIDVERCKQKNTNPYVCVCHEMIHVFVGGKCRIQPESDYDEPISYIFQDLLYQEFCKQNKKKIIKFGE